MKKVFILLIISLLFGKNLLSQNIPFSRPYISPEKIPAYLDEISTLGQTKQPGKLLRYYQLCQYIYILSPETFRKKRLALAMDSIVDNISDLPNSVFETNFLLYLHHEYEKEYLPNLLKAYELQPEMPDVWIKLINYYYYHNMPQPLKPVLIKLQTSGIVPGFVSDYSKDVMNSVEKDGILITHGLFDTYPLLILQYIENFRTDIKVIPLFSYLTVTGYNNQIEGLNKIELADFLINNNQGKEIYFTLTMDKSLLDVFSNDLFITGLAFKYDPEQNSSLELLENNYKKIKTPALFDINTNDLPPHQLLLYKRLTGHYLLPLLKMEEYFNAREENDKITLIEQEIDKVARISNNAVYIEKRRSINHLTH